MTSEVYPSVVQIDTMNKNTQLLAMFVNTLEVFHTLHFIVDMTLMLQFQKIEYFKIE